MTASDTITLLQLTSHEGDGRLVPFKKLIQICLKLVLLLNPPFKIIYFFLRLFLLIVAHTSPFIKTMLICPLLLREYKISL